MPRWRRKASGGPPPQEVYAGLRWTALRSGRNGSILRRDAHPDVYGLVADMPKPAAWTTVVTLGDNTTSMYTSTGGGMTGTGVHATVASLRELESRYPRRDGTQSGR